MSNLLNNVQSARCLADIKSAMHEVGCEYCDVNDMEDVAGAIRKHLVHGPHAVVNASLTAGPGVKVTPIERKGYKISANDEATITHDICDDIPKGTTINKALWNIVNKKMPDTLKKAAATPAIVNVELFKAAYDGVDYYENRAYGRNGKGRKTGLTPEAWYVKITLFAQCEPLYVCLGPVMEDMKREILKECMHMINNMLDDHKFHKPHHRPVCPPRPVETPDEEFGGFGGDEGYEVETPDEEFGGFGGDEGYEVETPDEEFGGFGGDEGYEVETPDDNNNCDLCNPSDDDIDTILSRLNP